MIIVLKQHAPQEFVDMLMSSIKAKGVQIDVSKGARKTILGLVGNTSVIDREQIAGYEYVDKVIRVEEPYKRASRTFHPADTVIDVGGVQIGGKKLAIIAGPCSVETPEQIEGVAQAIKAAGATMLRGGAFKPRTSPYSFQGLQDKGLDMLCQAGKKAHLPVVTEIMSADKIDLFLEDNVDIIQIGARNMQNFELLKAVGKTRKPVLLKRGLSATIEEWLMSAEYIMAGGNRNVILCERGIRTFETYTRNTLDLSAVLAVKHKSHLPIVVDPSHATGKRWMVEALSKAAIAAGADGVMIEVHNNPDKALCDGAQSITPDMFARLMDSLRQLAPIVGREL
ncbi:3-deoxy-7-phosphoheptulonate synthase [Megasphaera butyrica]|uniref:3-deoxy-7-phosphoheptulonate synthase n=1 Tax=Megasphaera butyrica TaxID=2981791 RepID=UPI0008204C07|nr:3-deoxy-7-phosphoheptulonate synthase [Megasphaera butyrica]MCU6713881.1 3-deoxy-7-phosphoheptulonate synthase [Megasphaera butyrica]SCH24843.1 Phospho-2-dehydro-3-deoxyheptonate aldolase [uncultured Megasphaera sp.]SCI62852.1 Phospho-2-dehydro-3-deoxyheptonate aldolase [uncultured Ruminococcus sp.]